MKEIKIITIRNVSVSVDCECSLKELTHSFGKQLSKDELNEMYSKLNKNATKKAKS